MADTPAAANERQARFFSDVRYAGVLFALQLAGGGWYNWTEEGGPCVPLWSLSEDAARCTAAAPEYKPVAINLATFLSHYLRQFAARGVWFAINPMPDLAGNRLPAAKLQEGLQRADA